MLKTTVASLLLATSLITGIGGCSDRTPQVITLPQQLAEIEHPGQMSVTGSATLEVSPDCADLTMSLTSEAAKAGAASASVQS